ncbi:MAG: FkbM family methyltransferase [Pseudomonadota bacterium]
MSAPRSLSYVLNRFVLRREYLTARADGLEFRVKTEDVVGRHLYKYGRHEPEMTAWLMQAVAPQDGDLIIDIGANIGWYAMHFAQLCKGTDARVLAFEPDPRNFGLLTENIGRNDADAVQPFQLALSDNDEGAALHQFGSNNLGRHSLLPINEGGSVSVATARLDDLLAQPDFANRRPRAVKMDIEGFELVALRGAPEMLARCPLVVFEYSPRYMRAGGIEPAALLHFMRGLGFAAQRLENGQAVAADIDTLATDDKHTDLIWTR